MPTVAVNPPKTPVTKGSTGISAATVPNVCKMPGPPAPFVPVPLPNIGKSGDSPSGYSTTVKIEGNSVAIKGATFKSMGDIASKGTGGGIVSANTHGPTEFVAPGSLNVKIEGKNVHLLTDAMVNNCGSPPNAATTPGVVQAPNVALPVLEFDRNEFKEKCANMENYMAPDNEMKLKRVSRKQRNANRRAALRKQKKAGKGRSLDEFPFASSNKGGKGAAVAPIKKREQNKQGGKLSAFYKKHKIKPGGKEFIVRIV